jgi:hypothetical protein
MDMLHETARVLQRCALSPSNIQIGGNASGNSLRAWKDSISNTVCWIHHPPNIRAFVPHFTGSPLLKLAVTVDGKFQKLLPYPAYRYVFRLFSSSFEQHHFQKQVFRQRIDPPTKQSPLETYFIPESSLHNSNIDTIFRSGIQHGEST